MPIPEGVGPGKYDPECSVARESAHAAGAMLIIIGGDRGSGFAVQVTPDLLIVLPEMLEAMAADIRRSREHMMGHS